jgi:hypothetical protein
MNVASIACTYNAHVTHSVRITMYSQRHVVCRTSNSSSSARGVTSGFEGCLIYWQACSGVVQNLLKRC